MTKRELTLGCNICPPNKGCNRNRDNDFKSWKRYRKPQWKESTHMPLEEAHNGVSNILIDECMN